MGSILEETDYWNATCWNMFGYSGLHMWTLPVPIKLEPQSNGLGRDLKNIPGGSGHNPWNTIYVCNAAYLWCQLLRLQEFPCSHPPLHYQQHPATSPIRSYDQPTNS